MINPQSLTIHKHTAPLTNVLRSKSDNSLGKVLGLVRSSHEAVFIFDDEEKFQGLVSPYKTLYSSNYPYTTKVSSIVFKPPTITESTGIHKVAEYMMFTKMYVLPVIGKSGEVQSVIYGKDILKEVIKNPGLMDFISRKVKIQTPITAPISASVKDVFHTLKEKGVSRMVIVDDLGNLAGIVSRSDFMQALIKPTAKMRFPKEGSHMGYYSLAGEKKFRKEEPILKYYTILVDSLPDDTPKKDVISHLITSSHDSIVLVDGNKKPTGFISTRDILQAISRLSQEDDVNIIIKKPSDSVSDSELEQAMELLKEFGKKLGKRVEIEKIEIATEEPKNPRGHTIVFNTSVIVTPVAGKALVAITKKRSFIEGIQQSISMIEKQQYRSGLSKEETAKSQKADFNNHMMSLQELQKEEESGEINFEELEKTSPQIAGEQSASGHMPNPKFVTRRTKFKKE